MSLYKQDFHDLVDAMFDIDAERGPIDDFMEGEHFMSHEIAEARRKIVWSTFGANNLEEMEAIMKTWDQNITHYIPLSSCINDLARYIWDEIRYEQS